MGSKYKYYIFCKMSVKTLLFIALPKSVKNDWTEIAASALGGFVFRANATNPKQRQVIC